MCIITAVKGKYHCNCDDNNNKKKNNTNKKFIYKALPIKLLYNKKNKSKAQYI